jgi:hypothetical protein
MKNKRMCDYCGADYEPIRIDQRFCKRECHDRHFLEERRMALAFWRQQRRHPLMVIEDDAEQVA